MYLISPSLHFLVSVCISWCSLRHICFLHHQSLYCCVMKQLKQLLYVERRLLLHCFLPHWRCYDFTCFQRVWVEGLFVESSCWFISSITTLSLWTSCSEDNGAIDVVSPHGCWRAFRARPGQTIPVADWAEAILRLQTAGLGLLMTDAASDTSYTRKLNNFSDWLL